MCDQVLPYPTLPQWRKAAWVGTGGFCQITGLCYLMFDLDDGQRVRLLLDRADTRHVFETLRLELTTPQRNINLPHWLISSLIPQSPGLSSPGHEQPPLAGSEVAHV